MANLSAPVVAVILAAGRSLRMGDANKLLVDLSGKPVLAHIIDSVLASQASAIVVVTGHESDRVRAAMGTRNLHWTCNPHYAEGLSTSLRMGIESAQELCPNLAGVLICLGDMPRVGTQHIDRVLAAFAAEDGTRIVAPYHDGRRGNPVLWPSSWLSRLCRLQGDEGARRLLNADGAPVLAVEMDDAGVLFDIDTHDDVRSSKP